MASGPIGDSQVAAFNADGYVLARGMLDDVEIDLLGRAARADRVLDQHAFGRADGEGGTVRLSLWNHPTDTIYGMIARSESNLAAIAAWIEKSKTYAFLASDPKIRSCTSICLKIVDPWFEGLDDDARAAAVKKLCSVLEKEGVALDIAGYRDAPAGLRIWGGATVERSDIEALLPWLDWAYAEIKS